MGATARPVPPSMVPARQPKSLLRALRGAIVSQAGGGGAGGGSDMLESERARSQLANATAAVDTGGGAGGRGGVHSTHLLVKDCFSSKIKEE